MTTSRATLFEVFADLLGRPEELRIDAPFFRSVGFFPRKPTPSTTIVATNGFANTPLHQATGPDIRQELIVVADDVQNREEVASLLVSLANEVGRRTHAIEHGEVFGPSGPLFPDSSLTALFATIPAFLPSTFRSHHSPDGVTIGVWLLPISDEEAVFARAAGPGRFQDWLEDVDDLYGFFRKPGSPR